MSLSSSWVVLEDDAQNVTKRTLKCNGKGLSFYPCSSNITEMDTSKERSREREIEKFRNN